MTRLTRVWKDEGITKATKNKLVHSLAFSVFMYVAEKWPVMSVRKLMPSKSVAGAVYWTSQTAVWLTPWTAQRTNISIPRELT